jgi:hypothetical protein
MGNRVYNQSTEQGFKNSFPRVILSMAAGLQNPLQRNNRTLRAKSLADSHVMDKRPISNFQSRPPASPNPGHDSKMERSMFGQPNFLVQFALI